MKLSATAKEAVANVHAEIPQEENPKACAGAERSPLRRHFGCYVDLGLLLDPAPIAGCRPRRVTACFSSTQRHSVLDVEFRFTA
jgi:hypothetical protein